MIKDSNANWFLANASTAFMFQGQRIPKDYEIVLPDGDFFITYLYHEPKSLDEEDIPATLTSEWLENREKGGVAMKLNYSMEKDTVLKIFMDDENNSEELIENLSAERQSNQAIKFNNNFPQGDRFRYKFVANVSYSFPYGKKTFLNQVVIKSVIIVFLKKTEFNSQSTELINPSPSFAG